MDEPSHILVRRAQERDTDALDILFRRYRDRLRLALRRMLGDRDRRLAFDSEDAAHEAILSALMRLQRFEYRGEGSFLAWLLKAAEFEVKRQLRAGAAAKRNAAGHRNLESVVEPSADGASPSEVAQGNELESRIQSCIERLPDREREVVLLRRYLNLDNEEIREDMQLPSVGAARALLSRAQARLASLLDGD